MNLFQLDLKLAKLFLGTLFLQETIWIFVIPGLTISYLKWKKDVIQFEKAILVFFTYGN